MVVVLGVSGWHAYHKLRQAETLTKCNAIGDEVCPSPEFLIGFDRLKELNEEIAKAETTEAIQALNSKKREARGLLGELKDAMPPGYDFNGDNRKFVKSKQSSAPAAEKK